jgi:hypothetical protein
MTFESVTVVEMLPTARDRRSFRGSRQAHLCLRSTPRKHELLSPRRGATVPCRSRHLSCLSRAASGLPPSVGRHTSLCQGSRPGALDPRTQSTTGSPLTRARHNPPFRRPRPRRALPKHSNRRQARPARRWPPPRPAPRSPGSLISPRAEPVSRAARTPLEVLLLPTSRAPIRENAVRYLSIPSGLKLGRVSLRAYKRDMLRRSAVPLPHRLHQGHQHPLYPRLPHMQPLHRRPLNPSVFFQLPPLSCRRYRHPPFGLAQ